MIKYYKADQFDMELIHMDNISIEYKEHNHKSLFVIGMVLCGQLQISRKGQKDILVQGDIFIVPPYEVHTLSSVNKLYSLISLCIREKAIKHKRPEECKQAVCRICEEMISQGILNQQQRKELLDAVDEIYTMISSNLDNNRCRHSVIKNYLENTSETAWNIEELSGNLNLSKYYLIRRFKQEIGLTPHSFLLQNRIRKAQYLLEAGYSIADAAAEVEFYDQSHFNKCFKKIVGLTPHVYLKSVKRI